MQGSLCARTGEGSEAGGESGCNPPGPHGFVRPLCIPGKPQIHKQVVLSRLALRRGRPSRNATTTASQTVLRGVLVDWLMTRKYLCPGMAPSLAKAQNILPASPQGLWCVGQHCRASLLWSWRHPNPPLFPQASATVIGPAARPGKCAVLRHTCHSQAGITSMQASGACPALPCTCGKRLSPKLLHSWLAWLHCAGGKMGICPCC